MGDGAAARGACIPLVIAVSAVNAGLKLKARSFFSPSPLMSDPTIGVNGAPDKKLPIALTSSPRVTGSVTVPTSPAGPPSPLGPLSRPLGAGAAAGAPNPADAQRTA